MQQSKSVARKPGKLTPYPSPEMKELFDAILEIRSKDEAANFFRDLLTIAELTEFANRWQMVKRLVRGESYLEIAEALNVSTTTVTRVAHWLKDGMGGYEAVASRLFDTRKNPDYHEPARYKSGRLRGMRKLNEM